MASGFVAVDFTRMLLDDLKVLCTHLNVAIPAGKVYKKDLSLMLNNYLCSRTSTEVEK